MMMIFLQCARLHKSNNGVQWIAKNDCLSCLQKLVGLSFLICAAQPETTWYLGKLSFHPEFGHYNIVFFSQCAEPITVSDNAGTAFGSVTSQSAGGSSCLLVCSLFSFLLQHPVSLVVALLVAALSALLLKVRSGLLVVFQHVFSFARNLEMDLRACCFLCVNCAASEASSFP
jgi:hypothetical protein